MDEAEVRDFFQGTEANILRNDALRQPQAEGYLAVQRHFLASNEHAILQIPVGCGKTGLMSILPFGIAEGRVLIIAPNLQIREDVSGALDITQPDNFWRLTNVLPEDLAGPFRAVLDGRDANLADCRNSHFVVTNIHQLASSADRWLPQFPDDFFDMILVDEGHHNVAPSWQRVFDRFPNAKKVSLTATPFRSDGQEVEGLTIYRYTFKRAMRRGYIKQLRSINAAPSEIYFRYQNDEHRHSLEEVLELREEAWFRLGVALSRETNISIVDASIQFLELLRQTGFRHQLVASTCSINHAREVASLYRERGSKAAAISSDMHQEERAEVLGRVRSGELDCIVQVQILGEGFDHKPLGVAAIFRPYRSLSPYVQFVGRIMRVNVLNAPYHPDNEGYVVSHIGLQQDELWQDFRRFDDDDQQLLNRIVEDAQDAEEALPIEEGRRGRLRASMVVLDEVMDSYIADEFFDPTDEGTIAEVLNQVSQLLGVPADELGLTQDDLRARLLIARQRAEVRPRELPVQPQDHRRLRRQRLYEASRSVAGGIVSALGLSPVGVEVPRTFPELGVGNNIGAAIQLMGRKVNEELGIEPGGRAELEAAELDRVYDRLDELADQVQAHIRIRLEGGADAEAETDS